MYKIESRLSYLKFDVLLELKKQCQLKILPLFTTKEIKICHRIENYFS